MESRPCYSVRLMNAFGRALRTYPSVPAEVIASIDGLDAEARIPVTTVHELLRGAIALSGDEDLGLKAAELIEAGDYGALEYAASTAQTSGEALAVMGRYMSLINDALTFSIAIEGERAIITLENAVLMPRAAEDFELAAFYVTSKRVAGGTLVPVEVRFSHPKPADMRAYERVFSDEVTLRFGQPVPGFAFPRSTLDAPLPTADPKLHELVRGLAERLLKELPKAESFTARARARMLEGLARGDSGAANVAAALHVSPRTLNRRLEQEGTNFKALFEEVRRGLALRYVGQTDLALSEIAFLLGFSQAAAFHRAFKRWTLQTPLEYRNAQRG